MKLVALLMLQVFLVAALFLSPAACEIYFVRGSSPGAATCPPEASSCLTLQEYVDNSSHFIPERVSDVELRFLSGGHAMSKNFEVRSGRNITLRSANVTSVWHGLDVTVNCTGGAHFVFNATTGLSVRGIAFSGCGGSRSALTLVAGAQDLHVKDVEFLDKSPGSIQVDNLYGVCSISDMISHSHYHLYIYKSASKKITLALSDIVLANAGIMFDDIVRNGTVELPEYSSITMRNVFTNGKTDFVFNSDFCLLTEGSHFVEELTIHTTRSLLVANSSFAGLQVFINIYVPTSTLTNSNHSISLVNCSFTRNSCNNFGFLELASVSPTNAAVLVNLKDLTFEENICTAFLSSNAFPSAILVLSHLSNVSMEGVHFTNNRGTPLLLINSTVHTFGENSFVGNEAFEGAGMSFINSLLILHNQSSLVFQNNYADNVGGAWHVINEISHINPYGPTRFDFTCFFDFYPPGVDISDVSITVNFVNNTARNGGNVLFGGNIDSCQSHDGFGYVLLSKESIFSYEPKSDLSRLASAPTRVCLCDNGVPNCLKVFSTLLQDIYPGQSFNVSVVAVGQRFGVVNGTVYSQIINLPHQPSSSLQTFQQSQLVSKSECTNLTYAIQSRNSMEIVALTTTTVRLEETVDDTLVNKAIEIYNYTTEIMQLLLSVPVYLNISLLACPDGFILSEELSECICDPVITRNSLTCHIDIGMVKRSGTVWVSYVAFNESTTDGSVVVSLDCPNGFCKKETQWIDVLNPDAQCSFNRSGVLCGGCPPGLSLALGSNRCLSCSNSYLALLIPFALCGVVLVVLIQVLDLTVAAGTINGLIFYANILKSYDSLFFLPDQRIRNILSVFVSWLNLNLGIETCFFDGMDGYIKTWLQFAFPFYLWFLAGLIVLLSRCTSRFSANNSVPVLATMVLLTYNKLLLTFILACAFMTLDWTGGVTLSVWKYNPIVQFMEPKHVILVLACFLVFAVILLPYTLMLTFYQCLLSINHKRGCRWVFKLKPFFDANVGPLKDKHLYWVGVLLLARVTLLLVNVISNSGDGTIIAIAIVSSLLILHNSFVGHVYKNWLLSLLENAFFFNLVILCVATVSKTSDQAAATNTSISVAFLQFIGIVCYHGYKRALRLYKKCRGRDDYADINDGSRNRPMEEAATRPRVNVTRTEVAINVYDPSALREPAVED